VMLRMLRIAALAGLCLAALANAGDELKYTGQIVAIESREGMIRLEEIGPWTGPTRGLHTRTIRLTPETRITLIGRSDGAGADGWVGQFIEAPLTAADLHRGDTSPSRRPFREAGWSRVRSL
jgi:hypothetical protein